MGFRPVSARRNRAPWQLVALATATAVFFVLPLIGLVARVPWNRLGSLLRSRVVLEALGLSLVSSIAAAALAVLLGVPVAWVLARVEAPPRLDPLRSVLRALVTLPMVLPPVVGGAALLFAFGRRGLFGAILDDWFGLVLPFSLAGVIMANLFVAMPFMIVTVEAALRGLDPRYEQAASSLGAGPLTVFRRVTLPLIRPSVIAGTVLAWARALGEFGATLTFAGNLGGRTQTLPLAVAVELERDRDAAVAISLILVVVSLLVLIGLRDRWWNRS